MNKCALLVLMVEAVIRPETEGRRRLDGGYVDESYAFITVVGTKITPLNRKYFNIKQYDFEKENFMRDCFGSAIANHWVLTAAHCALGPSEDKRIILDEHLDSTQTSSYRHVVKCIIHPKYGIMSLSRLHNSDNLQITVKNDIGLLMVESLKLRRYGQLASLHYEHLPGKHVSYHRYLNPHTLSFKTRKETVMKHKNIEHGVAAKCEEEDEILAFKYRWFFRLEPSLCVVAENTQDQKVQRGASGGPLMSGGKIIGVATGTRPLQFHYTPVSPYINWISKKMLLSERIEVPMD